MPNRLREFREARGLSLKDLGKAVGRSHQAIAQYETGKQPIPDEILVKAATVLECSTEDLVQGDPDGGALREVAARYGRRISDREFILRLREAAALCYERQHRAQFAVLDELIKQIEAPEPDKSESKSS